MPRLTRPLTLCLAATALAGISTAALADVTIGAVYPLTGGVAYDGQTKLNGAQIAVDEVNAAGGVLGETLVLETEDGACNPAQSVAAAEKLITETEVAAILGAFCSSSSGSVMEVAQKYGIPHMTGVSTATSLTERGNPWFFRATATTGLLADAFGQAIMDTGAKKFAFFVVNDDWGRAVAESYGNKINELGGEVVATEIFSRDESDLFPYVTKIKAAAPDAVITAANTQQAANLTTQLRQLGITVPIMGEGSFASQAYLDLVEDMGEGVVGLVEYVPSIDSEKNKAFVEEYVSRYVEEPTKFSAAGYNTVHIMADAINRAGSTDPEAIKEALAATDFDGLTGNVKFADNGQAYNFTVYLAKVTDGVPEVIGSGEIPQP